MKEVTEFYQKHIHMDIKVEVHTLKQHAKPRIFIYWLWNNVFTKGAYMVLSESKVRLFSYKIWILCLLIDPEKTYKKHY